MSASVQMLGRGEQDPGGAAGGVDADGGEVGAEAEGVRPGRLAGREHLLARRAARRSRAPAARSARSSPASPSATGTSAAALSSGCG